MSKKQNKNIITYDMQLKALEIISEGEKTSLESKRINFRKYIEEYYKDFTGNSDILVERYHDIDFFASTFKDIMISILIGLLSSMVVTLIFSLINVDNKLIDTIIAMCAYVLTYWGL